MSDLKKYSNLIADSDEISLKEFALRVGHTNYEDSVQVCNVFKKSNGTIKKTKSGKLKIKIKY